MIIEQITLTESGLSERDYMEVFVIKINGDDVFCASDGEPEDNTLSRNFNDAYKLLALFERVHQAGSKGEELEIIKTKVDEL